MSSETEKSLPPLPDTRPKPKKMAKLVVNPSGGASNADPETPAPILIHLNDGPILENIFPPEIVVIQCRVTVFPLTGMTKLEIRVPRPVRRLIKWWIRRRNPSRGRVSFTAPSKK